MKKNECIFRQYILILNFLIFIIELKWSFNHIINNIIELGGENFRYNRFSLNSKGDMIIDTTSNPGNNERKFFGLKKNGRPYFFNENNTATPYRSLFAHGLENENQQKLEAESNFVIFSKQNTSEIKEYLISISKYDDYNELYDFEKNEIIAVKSSKMFKSRQIISSVSSFIKSESKLDGNNNYYIAYICTKNGEYKFYVLRCYFISTNILDKGYHFDTGSDKSGVDKAITSCFETETKKIACFYQRSDYKYSIVTFNESIKLNYSTFTNLFEASNDPNIFFKAIHLKKEIGIFVYYINIDDEYPVISLKYCEQENNQFYDYKKYNQVKLNKMSFDTDARNNDIIKINDDKFCFVSVSKDKFYLILVIFNFYDDDSNMIIRYYKYYMKDEHEIQFYNDLRAFKYNDFICVAFSHYQYTNISYHSSLIIFNYPNNTNDRNEDILQYIYSTNNFFDNFTFILDENVTCDIENNIFGYSCNGIIILDYPEGTTLIYTNDKTVVEKKTKYKENYELSLIFEPKDEYKEMNYTIEFAFVVKEPEYDELENYISRADYTYRSTNEIYSYTRNEFVGRSAFFNLSLKENLTTSCNDKCILCYKTNINFCAICKYNYTFNEDEKICFSNPNIKTTLIISSLIEKTNIFSSKISSTYIIPSSSNYLAYSTYNLPYSTYNKISSTIQKSTILTKSESTNVNSSLIQIKTTLISTDYSLISSTKIASISSNSKTSLIITSVVKTTQISSFFSSLISSSSPSTFITNLKTSSSQLIYSTSILDNNNIPISSSLYYSTNSSLIKDNINSTINENNDFKCTSQEIINGNCDKIISDEQIQEIYEYIKENMIKNNTNNTIIKTKNVVFQISTIKEQNNNIVNISSVDLGECEGILKKEQNLTDDEELIIFKIDIKNLNLSLTYVQYEIYNAKETKEKLSLEACENTSIIIKSPITLGQDLENMYLSMNNSGYNLFDLNDSFYTDICSTYTSEYGTDISMADRKESVYDFYTSNLTLCQDNCTFISYDYTYKKSECECDAQTEETETDSDELTFNKKSFIYSFYNFLKYSNFRVLKCYKLVFSIKGQINNIGSYILIFMLVISFITFFLYCFKGSKIIDRYIFDLALAKISIINNERVNTDIFEKNKRKKISKKKRNTDLRLKKKTELKKIHINNNNINIYINHPNNKIIKKNKKRNKNFPPKKKSKNPTIFTKVDNNDSSSLTNIFMKNITSNKVNNKLNRNDILLNTNKKKNNKKEYKTKKKLKLTNHSRIYQNKGYMKKNFIENELNKMRYEEAIIYDKRTYCQYYCSLIKIKHLILFTFFSQNDYNLFYIKLCLLLFSFSIYFIINGFFFVDETMNKIYNDKGKLDLLYQIPQIFYSLLISSIINLILKKLSLTEGEFLSLRTAKIIIKEEAMRVRKNLKIKIIIFYIISEIMMILFWYYISCFCAVYKNTQLILIKDTLASFGLSMVYPFGLYLIPGIFRIPSLRAASKNNKPLFIIGNIIALI